MQRRGLVRVWVAVKGDRAGTVADTVPRGALSHRTVENKAL